MSFFVGVFRDFTSNPPLRCSAELTGQRHGDLFEIVRHGKWRLCAYSEVVRHVARLPFTAIATGDCIAPEKMGR
jgi:hypothetical protein